MSWKRTLIPILLLTSTNAMAAAGTSGPPSDEEAKPELLELRGEMAEAGKEEALNARLLYRPLCDAEGYPLVGNLMPKQPDDETPSVLMQPEPPFQPSEFCTVIRADQPKA